MHENVLAVLLVGLLTVSLLAVFAPSLIVGDTWLTLVAGREITQHGLPDVEELTVLGRGRIWTDQQWLAQLATYGLWRAGGLGLVVLGGVAAVTLAFTLGVIAARRRGATPLACAVVLLPVIVGAPWAWTMRAQVLALPLYVLTVWTVVSTRHGLRPRTFLVLPALVLWANLHGSVVLGTGLVVVAAALVALRPGAPARTRLAGLALALGAVAAVFVTPYRPGRIADYYQLFLFDSPFAGLLREWERTGLDVSTATFWVLAAATLALCLRHRRRLAPIEWVVLAVTFAGAVQAIRGVVWFVLAVLVILPQVLTGALGQRAVLTARAANVALAGALALGVLLAGTALLTRDDASLTTGWPTGALPVIARELEDDTTLVWGTDGLADWLLWELPELRGRLAFDVRFELYTRGQIEDTIRWNGRVGEDWSATAAPYRVVLLNGDWLDHLSFLERQAGTRVAYSDEGLIVVVRPRP